MKALFFTLSLLLFFQLDAFAQTEFTLDPSQSMIMTGKGPGQDATINPFYGEDCYAIVANTGTRDFSVRIQRRGKVLAIIEVPKGETKRIELLGGQELYLDPNPRGTTNATVDYERMERE